MNFPTLLTSPGMDASHQPLILTRTHQNEAVTSDYYAPKEVIVIEDDRDTETLTTASDYSPDLWSRVMVLASK